MIKINKHLPFSFLQINKLKNRYLYAMIRYFPLFLFLTSFSLGSFSQTNPTIKDHKKDRAQETKVAHENILLMKEGVLLVRLNFKTKEVTYFEKYNNTKEAIKIKNTQQLLNQYIIDAFDSLFVFCPVYFFGEKNSRNVLEGKMDSVVFYNLECLPDSTIKWKGESFFIAEFGRIEGGESLDERSKFSAAALVIRDAKFQQLRGPFPYYSIYHEWGVKKKKFRMPTRRMTESLEAYYKRVKG